MGLGAAIIGKVDPDATIAVMPADHAIEPVQEFRRALHAAEQFANDFPEKLITFGIRPTFPSTGYGYIKRGDPAGTRQAVNASSVVEFKEKPLAEVAEQYVASGDYDWNSGIFVWKPRTILGELHARKPEIHATVLRIAAAWGTPAWTDVFRASYETAEKISIDFAVMQEAAKAGKVLVLNAPYTWDDVGSWLALERGNPQDADEQHRAGAPLRHQDDQLRDRRRRRPHDRDLWRQQPAHRPGRQRHPRGRPQVRGQGEGDRGQAEDHRTRGVHVSAIPTPPAPLPEGRGEFASSPLPSGRGAGGVGLRGPLLGIDFGTVRVGLAVCDPDRIIASPLETYTRKDLASDAVYFAGVVAQQRAVGLVVGLPLHSSGEESDKSREARAFATWLAEVTKFPVVMWDERFTTSLAQDAMIGAKLNRKKRKERVDRVAAQMILQVFLDAGCPAGGSDSILTDPSSADDSSR